MNSGLIKIAAVSANGFFRCGRHFPHKGVVLAASELGEDEQKRLAEEPMLRITPASDDDASQAEARAEQIAEGIRTLRAEDFQRDGKPKVEALTALLGDDLGKITASERNGVWDQMLASEFKAPEPAA